MNWLDPILTHFLAAGFGFIAGAAIFMKAKRGP